MLNSSPCSSSSSRQASSWKPSPTSSSWRLPDQLRQAPMEQIGLVCHLPFQVLHQVLWLQSHSVWVRRPATEALSPR